MSRREGGRLSRAFLISAAVHLAVVGVVWALSSRVAELPSMRVYAVNIVSPPPQAAGEPNPEPSTPEPEPEPEPEVEPEPEPEPEPPTPTPPAPTARPTPPRQETPRPTPPAPRPETPAATPRQEPPRPSTGDRPDPTSTGGENIDLQLRGVQCPSPEYCNNIIRQINRYFRNPGGNTGEADIYFAINRNGSVSNLRLQSATGSASFRLAVMEAVEQAGRNRAFGELPAAYQADQLPVSFYFRPSR